MNQEIQDIRTEWGEEIHQLRENSRQHVEVHDLIAFYGSSSIRLWDNMQNDLYPLSVANMAFGGSSYFLCDYFFEEIFEFITPSKLVLYAGDNDLGNEVPEADILKSVNNLIRKVDNKFGAIPISIISVKPSPDREHLREEIESLNGRLSELIDERPNGSFIDIYSAMLTPNRTLRPELYIEDQLHINEKGYEIWKRVIKEDLTVLT